MAAHHGAIPLSLTMWQIAAEPTVHRGSSAVTDAEFLDIADRASRHRRTDQTITKATTPNTTMDHVKIGTSRGGG
ncbi:MAG: hypothetical protein JNK85_25520, partial [Verrucomicrobiales bacterium]|nr:hypothetical protein [Verrucomicrobiales bacterium]